MKRNSLVLHKYFKPCCIIASRTHPAEWLTLLCDISIEAIPVKSSSPAFLWNRFGDMNAKWEQIPDKGLQKRKHISLSDQYITWITSLLEAWNKHPPCKWGSILNFGLLIQFILRIFVPACHTHNVQRHTIPKNNMQCWCHWITCSCCTAHYTRMINKARFASSMPNVCKSDVKDSSLW